MGDENTRVKFYSMTDFSASDNLVKAEEVIQSYDDTFEYNINDIIEFYNIQLYFENEIYLNTWTEEMKSEYKSRVKDFSKVIGKYFSQIDEKTFMNVFTEIDNRYIADFWVLFEKYKLFNRLSTEFFSEILLQDKAIIQDILKCKNIVNKYEQEITSYFLDNINCVEILLLEYVIARGINKSKYYFPSIMSDDDKNQMLLRYIESERAKYNYLKIIYEGKSTKEFPISDKAKLNAKRRYEEEGEKIFATGVGIEYGTKVSFVPELENTSSVNFNNGIVEASYSLEWIEENRDFPTLLNNFIYLFGFTDLQFRIQHVNKKNALGIFERVMGVKGKNEYVTGVGFNQIQGLAMLQMVGYYNQLLRFDIRLEQILKWFFECYLKEEFHIDGFYLNLPSAESTFLEKCRTIVSEIDSVLKQYKLFVEEKCIDSELLQLSSEHIFMRNIPSVIDAKYVYAKGSNFNRASYLLFSDQSKLVYIMERKKGYGTLFKMLSSEFIFKADFLQYQSNDIEWLEKEGYVYCDENGYMRNETKRVTLLKQLYDQEVLCRSYIEHNFKDELDWLLKKDMIELESSLLSRVEQDYFNYLLNKSEYSNGLDLRNKYVHGTQTMEEGEQEQHYYIFLRVLVLLVIKINEEFCLSDTE